MSKHFCRKKDGEIKELEASVVKANMEAENIRTRLGHLKTELTTKQRKIKGINNHDYCSLHL